MLNKHGYKMTGLRRASGETCDNYQRTGNYVQISYDIRTGEVLTNFHTGQSWSEYHDPHVETVCGTDRHMTMQEIADQIAEHMAQRAAWMAYEAQEVTA